MLRPTRCYQHGAAGPWKFVTLTAGSKRWSLLMARDDDEMFMTRSLNVTPKAIEQHLIVHSDKSVAYVTNNQRLLGGFCSIEANYWQIRSIVQPLCDSRATWEHLRCCTRTRMEAGIRATPILRDKPRHCRLSSFSFKSMDEWTKAAATDATVLCWPSAKTDVYEECKVIRDHHRRLRVNTWLQDCAQTAQTSAKAKI